MVEVETEMSKKSPVIYMFTAQRPTDAPLQSHVGTRPIH